MSTLKEYIVTVKSIEGIEDFYTDMESPGGALYIPNRAVEIVHRRDYSRNTHYRLTEKEATLLRNDPRVIAVELAPETRGVKADVFQTQISSDWNKSTLETSSMKNWGLLRCIEGEQRVNWGVDGTMTESGTISLTSSGKNVDVVIVDDNGIIASHPEFAINVDGTGGSRVVQYNWGQHDPEVKGTPASNYVYTISDHPVHVAGTVAGNTQGWARKANIYNIHYYAGAINDFNFPYVIDYVRAFHRNKPINPATGRKNPTIVNNSWGMSIFPSEWSLDDITAVTYRGVRYVPVSQGPRFTGVSGVCDSTSLIADLTGLENSGTRITSTGVSSATCDPITATLLGAGALTASTTPTAGTNDDGWWTIQLPFNISFLGSSYTSVHVGTNMYLTFSSGSNIWAGISYDLPAVPKIMVCADDRSVPRVFYGQEGIAPNRTFRIRIEGHTAYSGGTIGSPTMEIEYTFYEATPNVIDVVIGTNQAQSNTSTFSPEQLLEWGFVSGARIPQRVAALDADVEDAIAEGIIFVGAAGNGMWKHDVPGGPDWNNTFEMSNRYPGEVYYYMRGSSPTANDNIQAGGDFNINNICVGSVGIMSVETKASYSDCGPGVDIYAPGTSIMSALPYAGVPDPRGGYYIGKFSGTSMASPQVTGVLACALETYPNMTQDDAKKYILHHAKENQLSSGQGGPGDGTDLQGSPNLYLYYYKERKEVGSVYPKNNYKPRPTSGMAYPRPRIKRTSK